MYNDEFETAGEFQDVGFSLKKIKKALKKIAGKGGKKKVKKPELLDIPQGGTLQRLPLGFPTVTFNGSNPETEVVVVRPQKPFMPRKLIVNSVTNSTDGNRYQVTITSFRIGTEDMLAGSGAIPIETFKSDSVDALMLTKTALPGHEIAIRYELSPAIITNSGDSVIVSAALIGDAVG